MENKDIDITKRNKDEANIRRLATVVLDSNDAITIQDFEGQITAWNRGAELMYGYSELKRLNPKVKVIIASGYSDEKQDALLMEEGATVFVNKPYTLAELSKALASTIES
jgi:two-component system CheB/CheR fusion protein